MTFTAHHRKEKIKLVEKEKRKKTAEELYSLSQEALKDPELAKIIKNAPVKKDGHINLTSVYSAAFDYVYGQTKDLKKSKELAVATRWAAKFKDDYPIEFETEIIEANIKTTLTKIGEKSSQTASEPKPEPKDVEIELFGDIIFSGKLAGMPHINIALLRILKTDLIFNGIKMVANLLESITGIEPSSSEDRNWPEVKMGFPYNYHHNDEFPEANRLSALRDYLIKILEQKFGVKIRICGFCKNYVADEFSDGNIGSCKFLEDSLRNFGDLNLCPVGAYWVRKEKEIPEEKKEEGKTCANCGYADCTGLRVPCGNWIPMRKEENK